MDTTKSEHSPWKSVKSHIRCPFTPSTNLSACAFSISSECEQILHQLMILSIALSLHGSWEGPWTHLIALSESASIMEGPNAYMCFIKHLYCLSWSLLFQLYVNSLNQLDPRKPGLTRLHSLWLSSHKAELPSVLSIHYPIWRSVTDNKLAIPSGPTASFILAITGFWGATFFLKKTLPFLLPMLLRFSTISGP